MMNDLMLYFLESSIAMSLFYLVYRLFLQNETLYSVNRFYLIGTLVLSLVLPIIPFENLFIIKERLAVPTFIIDLEKTGVATSALGIEDNGLRISVLFVLQVIYLGGVSVLLGGLIFEVIRLIFMRREHKQDFGSMKIIFVNKEIIPFSWFNLMFLDNSLRENPQINTIIQHEYAHFKKNHFIDLLILEMISVFQWINPLVWLYLRSIREIHEYQADAEVLTKTKDTGSYQALLVNQLTGAEVFRLANAFSKSLTKKRMIMMIRMRSKRTAWLKALFAMPVLAILLMAFSNRPQTALYGEAFTCSGVVIKKESGDVIPGAHVLIKGTTKGSITDRAGRFDLEIDDPDASLIVSYVGFRTAIVPAGGEELKIVMEKGTIRLEPYEMRYSKLSDATRKGEAEEKANVTPESDKLNDEYYLVEELANFPGGIEALGNYLTENIRYPDNAIPGKTVIISVGFTVAADGSIRNVHMDEETVENMEREAVRVVEEMPHWSPAKQGGKPVRTDYILPVRFTKQF